MGNEWLFLIIILFVAIVLAGILLYYFLNIGKGRYPAITEPYKEKTKESVFEPKVVSGVESIKLNNLENLLRESVNRQNNIVGSISLLIQKIDNLEKRPLRDNSDKSSLPLRDDSKDAKIEKLSTEIEKISPLLRINTEGLNNIELKLKAQEGILQNIKESLVQISNAKVEKIEIKGIEELKSKINEITALLKIISGS